MTKQKKRRFWITATVIVLSTLAILFSPLADSVGAIFSNAHAGAVMWRVRNEIMQKSPAGQYYEALMWKHVSELDQILSNHPKHAEQETLRVIRMFIPGLEALLDGKGDTVRITEEKVYSLKAELDWLASVGSPSLQEDIEKEQQRFPLENFIGMTMSEALDFINSNFPPSLTAEPMVEPTPLYTEVPLATPIPTCLVGFDSNCLARPSFLADSNDQWAYYIYNGVYFEYPGNWQIQQNLKEDVLILQPIPESSEGMNTSLLALLFLSNLSIENWDQVLTTPKLFEHLRPNTKWKHLIYWADFRGFECYWKDSDSLAMNLEFFLYNENEQISVGLLARIKDGHNAYLIDNANSAEKLFPNIQHIAESFRISEP